MVIFLVLMNFFRTHIIRSFNVALLLAGMALYFMKPVSGNANHDAFTSWLQSNLKSGNNTSVLDQIKGLQTHDGELESVIRKASVLVKANAEDFKLPVDTKSKDENEVFQVLLKEWKAFQYSSTGMGKAVIIKQAQPYSLLPIDGFTFGSKSLAQYQKPELSEPGLPFDYFSIPAFNYHISPLSGGVAIGAP